MENATKALIIVSGVLIGIMILSIGISLFAALSGYVESSHEDIINNKVQQFNLQYTKYINYDEDTGKTDFTLTIQDVVTAANIACESNFYYGLSHFESNNYYVSINMSGYANLEKTINSDSSKILSDNLGKKYKCSNKDVLINPETGRVYKVTFHEIP